MDPNAWQAYHQAAQAYTNRFGSGSSGGPGQDEGGGPGPSAYHNPALSLLAASQHYQHNSLLPPSLLAAQQHKTGAQSLANHLLTPTPASTASWASDRSRQSVIEAKTSQPAFPGQPPPLQDARRIEASSPAFPGQPPPRQSSQPRSQVFPGSSSSHYSQPQESPGYGNNYSPGAPSPQSYNNVQSPQEYHPSHTSSHQRREERERQQRELERQRIQTDIREKQKEKERQERLRIAEERREQERIRQEQEFRREQERIRQEKEKEERIRKEQEERKRREREKQEQERRRREEEERRRREEERRKEEERRREQERIRQEQERIRQEQERIAHERKMQEERDLGLARLSAMGALNDLGEENNGYSNQGHFEQHQQQEQSNFNLNMFNQYQQNMIKQEQHEQKPIVNQFSNWINRANELLDLSSSDSRETSHNDNDGSNNFIPQILMNPWDPQTPPMMTFAPIANAMQQYQQQWLTQYQQATGMLNNDDSGGSFPLGRFKVLCIAPDEDMGFLINLPPPCNLLFQQEALVSKKVASPFIMVFQKFLKDPDGMSNVRRHLTEAPDKPPPYIEPEPEIVPKIKQEIKREYVPPYTPKATHDPESKAKLSNSGYSRSLEITPVRRSAQSRSQASSRQSFSSNRVSSSNAAPSSSTSSKSKPVKKNVSDDEDELPEIPPELLRRETSRRKAKDNLKAKIEAQEKLLLDQDDPTFNNPALDLDDSDDDAEWNPLKEAEKSGNKRKRGGDSSDEDEEDYSEFNNLHNVNNKSRVKKRAHHDNRKHSTHSENDNNVPEGEDFKVGQFLILKSDESSSNPPLWRVDGKTLIQKYERVQGGGAKEYKCVNTYSGWTPNTRHRYKAIEVKPAKSGSGENHVEWIKEDPTTNGKSPTKESEPQKKEDSKPAQKKKKNINVEEIRSKSRKETAQFQENFEVYMQTLISQCLDSNFLSEIFSEADDYFVTNIEKVDSVTLLRKDKLLTSEISWTTRFQHALAVWPCLNNLGSESCASTVCGACEKARAKTMLQLFGQPYNSNTLASLPPDQDSMMNRNFSVCDDCSELCHLYHNLHHQKQKLYVMCSEIVEKRKTSRPGIDTTQILNQLLADDSWLETQFKKMQDLWADADCFV